MSDRHARGTPVDLLLAAIGACTAIDVDILTSRRSEPEVFTVDVDAESAYQRSAQPRGSAWGGPGGPRGSEAVETGLNFRELCDTTHIIDLAALPLVASISSAG
jgi:hypothetical protein